MFHHTAQKRVKPLTTLPGFILYTPLYYSTSLVKSVFYPTYLVCVVKAVVHEASDQGRLSNCKKQTEQTKHDSFQQAKDHH